MKIQGTYTFEAPRERVWRALLDPEVLARTLPGCEKLERTSESSFRGALTVQVGPVKGQFQGTLDLSDLVPLEGYRMKLSGSGSAGFMNGEGTLAISGEGATTTLTYDIEAQVGGRIAGVGQRLVESSAKVVTKQGLEGLGRELAAMTEAEATGAPVVPPEAPSQAAMAAKLAAGVAADLIPPAKRRWLVGGLIVGLALLVLFLVRACG